MTQKCQLGKKACRWQDKWPGVSVWLQKNLFGGGEDSVGDSNDDGGGDSDDYSNRPGGGNCGQNRHDSGQAGLTQQG